MRQFLSNQSFITKMIRFFIVSCIGLIINTITFSIALYEIPEVIPIYPILLDLSFPERVWEFASVLGAIFVTTVWNFIINKLWTFRGIAEHKKLKIQTTQYMIVGAIGAIENIAIYGILTTFFNVVPIIAEIIAFIISVISNFLLNNYWTFAEKPSPTSGNS